MDKSKEEIEQICADIRRKMELETALGQLRWGYIGLAVVGVLSIAALVFSNEWRWWWLCFFLSPLMSVVNGHRIRRGKKPW